jgi:uncharacterized membrane protein YedE/YeeE
MNWTNFRVAACVLVSSAGSVLGAEVGPTSHPEHSGGAWSPYLVGALIGVLTWLTFLFSDKPLGASTAYARVAGMKGKLVAPRHTTSLKYFQENKPKVDWEVMLVGGAIIGALLAAWTGGEVLANWVPPMWAERFGPAIWPRLLVAFIGGGLMAIGARMAGGCTSGHGISGALQLSVSSWIALVCFFVGGVITAMLMFNI